MKNKYLKKAAVLAMTGIIAAGSLAACGSDKKDESANAENAKELGDYMESTGVSTLKGAIVSKCYLQMSQKYVLARDVKADVLAFVKVLGVDVPSDADVFYEK